MPPKKKTPPPIDRPLSKAYLRSFTGWSTAYPPGTSEPNSLREMENMWVDRNKALAVRPGLRYLSYQVSPDISPTLPESPGDPIGLVMVGSQEPFYTANGDKALLCGVRVDIGLATERVEWRAILFANGLQVVKTLTDPLIGFAIPQGMSTLAFSARTRHITYLQIDNKILALSDAGETVRLFYVGAQKYARRLQSIDVPRWEEAHKLTVVNPASTWITKQNWTYARNELPNPSFEAGPATWTPSGCELFVANETGLAGIGTRSLRIRSLPTRVNLLTSPLMGVNSFGYPGWHPHKDYGNPDLSKSFGMLKITDRKGKGTFLAYGPKLTYAVAPDTRYVLAFDYQNGTNVQPIAVVTFYNAAGARIGKSTVFELPSNQKSVADRYTSPAAVAPESTVAMRVSFGGRNLSSAGTWVRMNNVVLCKEGEATTAFDGDGGTNMFWLGARNESASVFHPPRTVSITSPRIPLAGGVPYSCGAYFKGTGPQVTVRSQQFDRNGVQLSAVPGSTTTPTGTWARFTDERTCVSNTASGSMTIDVANLPRNVDMLVDLASFVPGSLTPTAYFDGDNPDLSGTLFEWEGAPHNSPSVRKTYAEAPILPTAATPTATTLVNSDAAKNVFKVAAFYTFENEMGESAASQITEIRIQRPWSNWNWTDSAGVAVTNPNLCADQLVFTMPQAVYDQAIAQGATRWNLYVLSWSDQEPVPVEAMLTAHRDLRNLPAHKDAGWLQITPQRKIGINMSVLPTEDNRENYSKPPRSRAGLVAGDRMILVGDPSELATIRWTSNRPGEYLNLTPARGGGAKTLTTGNLHIPTDVVLWQNPQSVDTLAILCAGSDGLSISYYMMPASVNAQSGTTSIMGFEETTSTPGSLTSYGNEILNNALYRPLDNSLLKSTANNYNINHKTQTDKITNMWKGLQAKEWIMSAALDNRLYYLVHNPLGEPLRKHCKGNEIWVYDITAEMGHWSRFLIQGTALRVFSIGPQEVVGVTQEDGLYYLDPTYRRDDYVMDGKVHSRPIPWKFMTNTQGANRAHDAWAHVQQVGITLGNFLGSMEYGVIGHDLHGKRIEVQKRFVAEGVDEGDGMMWDVDDVLLIRRDMKEWFLWGCSTPGEEGHGIFSYAQYRYTPVSVNVGYEFGSIETFEYGTPAPGVVENGIPLTYMDYSRP